MTTVEKISKIGLNGHFVEFSTQQIPLHIYIHVSASLERTMTDIEMYGTKRCTTDSKYFYIGVFVAHKHAHTKAMYETCNSSKTAYKAIHMQQCILY